MKTPPNILIIRDSPPISGCLEGLMQQDNLRICALLSCQDGQQRLRAVNPNLLVVDCPHGTAPGGSPALLRLLEAVDAHDLPCLLLSPNGSEASRGVPDWVQTIDSQITHDELWGRIQSILHTQRMVRQAQLEVHHMQRLGRHLNKQFAELDQDMRLASRLQREFLPSDLPEIDGVKFSVLYRPASWVSGDIYDIARVDENHVCLYVADAVGHGMAASLLTIYIKRALRSKELNSGGYRLLSPQETLRRLNDDMVAEQLHNSQFVTASYALLNHKEMILEYSRGGHPYPILIDPSGDMTELKTEGGLLGLFPGLEFPSKRVKLTAGQKVIIHSDGMEAAFVEDRDYKTGEPRYKREFQKVAALPAEELTARLEHMMDVEEGSLNPRDDVTIIVVQVTG